MVGLGNPGAEYRETWHNLGFLAVEEFCGRRGFRWSGTGGRSSVARGRCRGEELLVARPGTYMNRSGEAVRALLAEFRSEPADLVVVCDDAALDRGLLRVRAGGSDGGHRGLRSIIEAVGSEQFARLRMGIRTADLAGGDLSEEVLAVFTPAEREAARELAVSAADCLDVILEQGLQVAMNRYNRRQPRDPADPAAGQRP